MALVQVQKKKYSSTSDGTSHDLVLDSAPTEDNLVIVFVCHDGSISSGPSGYTQAVSAVDFIWGRCYYKVAGASESATINVTLSGADPCCIQAFEYSGILISSPFDESVSATGVGSGTTIISGTTGTTDQDNEIAFVSANMRMDVGGQSVTAWTNSFSIEDEAITTGASNTDLLLNVASKILSATGTVQSTGTITTGGIAHDVALVATFRIANDPPTATISWFTA